MSIVNKKDLVQKIIEALPENVKVPKGHVEKILNEILVQITEAVKRDERVQLNGFGTFKQGHRKARNGRNPKTGEEIKIPASKTVAFSVADAVKKDLNGK